MAQPTAPDDDDERGSYDAGKEAYRNRRDAFIKERYGLTNEDMALLNQTGVLDKTDVNLIAADATYKLFGGFGAAEKRIADARRAVKDVERAQKDVEQIAEVADTLRKIFRL